MSPAELLAPMWIALCAMLVAVAAAVLATIASFRVNRILDDLEKAVRQFHRAVFQSVGPPAPAPAPATAEDPPTETMPSVYPPGSLPLDGPPPAGIVRPFLARPRPARTQPRHGSR